MSIEYVSLIENFLKSELNVGFDEGAIPACTNLSAEQLDFFASQLHGVDKALHLHMVRVDPRETSLKPMSELQQTWAADGDIQPVSAMFRTAITA